MRAVLELTALPSLQRERWEAAVRGVDALLVAGGDTLYLAHWVRESGLLDLVPSLADTVWVGISAGSMVMTPRVGQGNMMAEAEQWVRAIDGPAYAVDDQTAFVVVDGEVEVVSEGTWTRLR